MAWKLVSRIGDREVEEILTKDQGDLWCAIVFTSYVSYPCKVFMPEFQGFAESHKEIYCADIVAEENPSLCDRLGVTAVPTTVILHKGKRIQAYEGPYTQEALKGRIEDLIKNEGGKLKP